MSFDGEWDEDDYAALRILTPPLVEPGDGRISGATSGEQRGCGKGQGLRSDPCCFPQSLLFTVGGKGELDF